MEKEFQDKTQYPKTAFIGILIPIFIISILLVSFYNEKLLFFILLFAELVLILSAFYIYKTTLYLSISNTDFYYELNSFFKDKEKILLKDISEIELIPLDYISKFGGWGKRKNKNGIAYIFNDGYFLKIQTSNNVYYFSISDKKKNECLSFIQTMKNTF